MSFGKRLQRTDARGASDSYASWRGYGLAVAAVLFAFMIRTLLHPWLGERSPFLLFVLAVFGVAAYAGVGPGLLATLLSAGVGVFFFLPPSGSFRIGTIAEAANFGLFIAIGLSSCLLVHRLSTARHRLRTGNRALAASEEAFRILVEGVTDYAIFMLDPSGRIVSWNTGAERINGYQRQEIIGEHFSCLFLHEDIEAGKPERELATARTRGVFREESWRVRKDGSRFWAAIVVTALRDEQGGLRGYAKVTRDVTERREHELQLVNLNESLERRVADRTHQLEEANHDLEAFAYTVSHDLRAPLRSIQGFGQALAEDYGERLDDEGRNYCDRLVNSAFAMERLIDDLLVYSRLSQEELELRSTSLARVVEEAQARISDALRERGAQVSVSGPLPDVVAHHGTLVQIIANLIDNAAKFVPPGVKPEVAIRAEQLDGRVRIVVDDNGIGVAAEFRERIFGVFERLHGGESYPGTGIGLAIVARGTERMEGHAGMEARAGGGSRFWIELAAGDSHR